MSWKAMRWVLSVLTLLGVLASLVLYWPDARATGTAVVAVLLAMMVGLYVIEVRT